MRLNFNTPCGILILLLICCSGCNAEKKPSGEAMVANNEASGNGQQSNGIVGEWEQQYTCKDVKFKGTYEIQEKAGSKKLVIQGGDNLRYTILELTQKELILGSSGAFIVFKRI